MRNLVLTALLKVILYKLREALRLLRQVTDYETKVFLRKIKLSV